MYETSKSPAIVATGGSRGQSGHAPPPIPAMAPYPVRQLAINLEFDIRPREVIPSRLLSGVFALALNKTLA